MKPAKALGAIALDMLSQRQCAACGGALLPGPRGGAAQNFYCANRDDCRQGFNLTFWRGELVFAQPIGEVDDQLYALYLKQTG